MQNFIIKIIIAAGAALIITLLLRRFVCAFAYVKGKSMMDTLNDREILFVLRYGLFGEPKRFDVVLCRYPGRKGLFVKRIIGMPGETVSMEEDVVFINGEPLNEEFARRKCLRKLDAKELGPGEYYVMGDNRPVSTDSRRVGPIQRKQILTKAIAVVYPFRMKRRIK